MQPLNSISPNNKRFVLFTWLSYLAVLGFTMYFHEPWRDEWQAWLIVKNSDSIGSLFQKLGYEGHPSLWYLLLWIVQLFTNNIAGMQLLHFIIAAATALVWLRYAPFNKLQKALFLFGYFPLYEYGVISRNYGISLLLLFVFLLALTKNRSNYILQAFLLCLLMQTNLVAFIVSGILALSVAYNMWQSWKTAAVSLSRCITVALILSIGVWLCAFTVWPPGDIQIAVWRSNISFRGIGGVFKFIWQVMFPIPQAQMHFWNTNFIQSSWLMLGLSVLIFIGLVFLFARNRQVLLIFFAGSLAILVFMYLKYLLFIRHSGHIYLLFITCLWLLNIHSRQKPAGGNWIYRRNVLVTTILSCHVLAGLMACYIDWKQPFTGAKAAASFLKHQYSNTPIAADPDVFTFPISGYLGKPLYNLRTKKDFEYITWNTERVVPATDSGIIESAKDYAFHQQTNIILILRYRLNKEYEGVNLIASFEESIEEQEMYIIYELTPKETSTDIPYGNKLGIIFPKINSFLCKKDVMA